VENHFYKKKNYENEIEQPSLMSLKCTKIISNMRVQELHSFKKTCNENLDFIIELNNRRLFLLELHPNSGISQDYIENLIFQYNTFINRNTYFIDDFSELYNPSIDQLETYLTKYRKIFKLQKNLREELQAGYKHNRKLPPGN
jgi:hypothetical protein